MLRTQIVVLTTTGKALLSAPKGYQKNVQLRRTEIMTQSISPSDNWEFADWKGFQKVLFRLQRRIFKAQSRMAQSVARRDFDAPHRAEVETRYAKPRSSPVVARRRSGLRPVLKDFRNLFFLLMQLEC